MFVKLCKGCHTNFEPSGAERYCPKCKSERTALTARRSAEKRRLESKEKFFVPGDGEYIFVVCDNTHSFRKGSSFRENNFIVSMKEKVWPPGMVVRRGNVLSIIDNNNQARALSTEQAREIGL